jgi:hypothetical protein
VPGSPPEESWFDADAGPLVRPFAIARGRTRPDRHDLDMITLVIASGRSGPHGGTGDRSEYARILRVSRHPVSVAEVAAALDLPIVVVKVLLGDLIDSGELLHRSPPRNGRPESDPHVLQAVLDVVRSL